MRLKNHVCGTKKVAVLFEIENLNFEIKPTTTTSVLIELSLQTRVGNVCLTLDTSSFPIPFYTWEYIFFYQGFLSQTLIFTGQQGKEGSIFIALCHLHPLMYIQTFLCYIACDSNWSDVVCNLENFENNIIK